MKQTIINRKINSANPKILIFMLQTTNLLLKFTEIQNLIRNIKLSQFYIYFCLNLFQILTNRMESTSPQNNNQENQLIKSGRQVVLVEGQLRKIIHEQGQGQCPQKGQQIFALYKGTLQTGEQFDANQDRDSPFNFTLGQGRVIKGWDEGFASMKKGQKATLICSPDYAYGKRGSPPRIPPNSTLNFEVQLLDFKDKKKEKWDLSNQQKVAQATNFKNKGNQAFKQGAFRQASGFYNQGIDFINEQDNQQGQSLLKILRLNAAQAQLKYGQYGLAIINCTKVLQKDSNNIKALYRRGVGYLKNQQFEKAHTDLQSLLKLQPGNAQAQKQLQNIKAAEKALRQKQKKVFGNMFSKAGVYSQEPKKQQTKHEQVQQRQEQPQAQEPVAEVQKEENVQAQQQVLPNQPVNQGQKQKDD